MDGNNPDYKSLANILAGLGNVPAPVPPKLRIQTKRGRRSEQFSAVSKVNVAIVDELIKIAESLANESKGTEAAKIIQIIRKLLDNNHALQQVVSEALLDIPT